MRRTCGEPVADEAVLWTMPDGVRCVLVPYDDRRVQLRLVRRSETVTSALFASQVDAFAAADAWRERLLRQIALNRSFCALGGADHE